MIILKRKSLHKSSSSYLIVTILITTNAKVSLVERLELEDGSTYSGEVRNGKPNGYGTLTEWDRSNYTGTFIDGLKEGNFTVEFINGDSYEGEYRSNEENGEGVQIYEDGSKYVGEFKDGDMHGWGNWSYPEDDQEVKYYDGEWDCNDFNSYGKLIYDDGAVYNGFFKRHVQEGNGLFYWPDGEFFFGRMRDNNLFKGILVTPKLDIIFARFKNGKAHGDGYKVSVKTRQILCIKFEEGDELEERSCHSNPVSIIDYDDLEFYDGEVLKQSGQQLKQGFGEFFGDDQIYIGGNWKEDVQQGFGIRYVPWEPTLIGFLKGEIIEGSRYNDALLDGIGVTITNSGNYRTLAIGDWHNGLMEGPGLFSYSDGDVVLGYFVKGRLDHDKNPIYIHSNSVISDTWFKVL